MKYDNLARSLSMMEDELKRADERVKNAEARVVVIEDELAAIGENQKQLEVSEEKARKREEKYQDQIKQLNIRHGSLTGFPKKQNNLSSFFDVVFVPFPTKIFFDLANHRSKNIFDILFLDLNQLMNTSGSFY